MMTLGHRESGWHRGNLGWSPAGRQNPYSVDSARGHFLPQVHLSQ